MTDQQCAERLDTLARELRLNPRERILLEAVAANPNGSGTAAALAAGYTKGVAPVKASNLINSHKGRTYLTALSTAAVQRTKKAIMDREEVLRRLSQQARGDMGHFLTVNGGEIGFDLAGAKKAKRTKLIRKLAISRKEILGGDEGKGAAVIEDIKVELYDAQAALDKLAKAHGIYADDDDAKRGNRTLTVNVLSGLPPEVLGQMARRFLGAGA